MNEEYARLWRAFIATLDEQEHDWRASEVTLAVSLLERFDEWLTNHKEFHEHIKLLTRTVV